MPATEPLKCADRKGVWIMPETFRKAKELSARTGRPLMEIIEESLAPAIEKRHRKVFGETHDHGGEGG